MNEVTTAEASRRPLAAQLWNGFGGWLESAGLVRYSFRPEEMIEEAERRTGCHDFGEGEFREPLARLLASCREEARLNSIGKLALRSDVGQTLCNRLRLERDRKVCAAIGRQIIQQPIFIIGLPRTGTTLLHTLLALDPTNAAPLTWEVMQPCPAQIRDERPYVRGAARNLRCLHWLAPALKQVHEIGAQLPQECVAILTYSFLSDQFDTMYHVPSYQAWLETQGMLPAYQYHHRFLQHLQNRRGARRWILKAPTHMTALPELLTVYPDALIVQTHREPLAVMASVASLTTILRRVFSDHVDSALMGGQMAAYWSEALTVFLRARDALLIPQRICDVHFAELQRDPLAAVRRIYGHFGMELTDETAGRMRAYLDRNPAGKHGRHTYRSRQFGIDAAEQGKRFALYSQRFDLERNGSTI